MTREQIMELIDKVATMRIGHDSLGPTGITGHFSQEEQNELIAWGLLALKTRAIQRPDDP